MTFEVGSHIRLVAGGHHVFRILEVDVDGNPDSALVEPVEDAPGAYPFRTALRFAVAAEPAIGEDTDPPTTPSA